MNMGSGGFSGNTELSEEILVDATSSFFEGTREPNSPIWDSILDPDVLSESPVGAQPTIGIDALRDQFGVLALRWQRVSITEIDLHLCGRRVAATFDITVRDYCYRTPAATDPCPDSVEAMSKRTSKKRAKARRNKANKGRKPNAGR